MFTENPCKCLIFPIYILKFYFFLKSKQLHNFDIMQFYHVTADLGTDPVNFALLDSEGRVAIWDSRKYTTPLHHVDTGLKNTRGDSIQIEVSGNEWEILHLDFLSFGSS